MDQSLMPRKIRDLTHGKTYLKGVISLGVGMRWRIGSGSLVRIFTKTDGYHLPAPKHGSIISPILDITLDATVSILIDHDLCN